MGYFLREVNEQGRALRAVAEAYRDAPDGLLEEAARLVGPRPLLFTGMGSSWAAALAAEAYLVGKGRLAVAVDSGEALYRWGGVTGGREGLFPVVISQSGESPEIVKLASRIASPFIAITNDPESALGRRAAVALPLHAGKEEGVTNKTFINSIAVALLLSRSILSGARGDRSLQARDLLQAAQAVEEVIAGGEQVKRLYRHLAPSPPGTSGIEERTAEAPPGGWDLIGRGSGLAAVHQGALVLRELTGRLVAPFTGGLYRHGPVYRSGPSTRAIILAARDEEGQLLSRLAGDIVERGGRAAFISDFDPGPAWKDPSRGLLHLPLTPVGEGLFPIAAIVPLELLGIADAAARGFEPGVGVPKITPLE